MNIWVFDIRPLPVIFKYCILIDAPGPLLDSWDFPAFLRRLKLMPKHKSIVWMRDWLDPLGVLDHDTWYQIGIANTQSIDPWRFSQ